MRVTLKGAKQISEVKERDVLNSESLHQKILFFQLLTQDLLK